MWRRSAPEEASASPVSVSFGRWRPLKENAVRAAREYLATLDDAAFGAASSVTPKFKLPIRSGGAGDRRAQGPCLLRLRRQLSDRHRSRHDRRRRGDPSHPAGGGGAAQTMIDKSTRTDGTFSRDDFAFNSERDRYTCPAGKELVQYRRVYSPRGAASAPMACDFTAPPNWIATWASSSRIAAPARRTKATHERRRRS